MGNFSIPVKDIVVNSDSQISVIETGTLSPSSTLATGTMMINGFMGQAVAGANFEAQANAAADKMVVKTGVAAAKEDADFTFTLGAAAGDVVIIRETSLDLTPSEFQNQAVDKRYQLPVCADSVATAVAVAAAINADPFSKVTATAPGASVLTLVAKEYGSTFDVYTGEGNTTLVETTPPVKDPDVVATLGFGNYDTLKNIEWGRNEDTDRNAEYYPSKGVLYNTYYYEVNWSTVDLGGADVPSMLPASGRTGFRLYIAQGLTANTDIAALATKLNA